MADIEIKTEVRKPVEEVFKLVADIPNYSKWAPPLSSMFIENKVSPGPGVGTTFEDKLHYGRVTGIARQIIERKASVRKCQKCLKCLKLWNVLSAQSI